MQGYGCEGCGCRVVHVHAHVRCEGCTQVHIDVRVNCGCQGRSGEGCECEGYECERCGCCSCDSCGMRVVVGVKAAGARYNPSL